MAALRVLVCEEVYADLHGEPKASAQGPHGPDQLGASPFPPRCPLPHAPVTVRSLPLLCPLVSLFLDPWELLGSLVGPDSGHEGIMISTKVALGIGG